MKFKGMELYWFKEKVKKNPQWDNVKVARMARIFLRRPSNQYVN